jgi:hypothetical protein
MSAARRLLVSVAAIFLLAAACGDDGAGTATPSTTSSSTVPESPTTTTELPTTEPIVLTDSFRGVTADTILVGFPTIDFEAINTNFGLELNLASFTPPMERMVEDLNDRGGINGRRVELVVRPFLPIGPTEVESICIELTEDLEVFAVLGGFAGPGAEEVNECFTDLHSTILVGGNPTPEQQERAKAPWITQTMRRSRRATGLVELLIINDRLEELGTIAIIASTANDSAVVVAAREAFDHAGTDVAFDAIVSTTGDELQTRAEIDTIVERGRADDVDTFMFIGDDAFANEQLILYGDEFNLLWHNSAQVGGWGNDPPPRLDEAKLILASGPGESGADDPEWGNCIRLASEA